MKLLNGLAGILNMDSVLSQTLHPVFWWQCCRCPTRATQTRTGERLSVLHWTTRFFVHEAVHGRGRRCSVVCSIVALIRDNIGLFCMAQILNEFWWNLTWGDNHYVPCTSRLTDLRFERNYTKDKGAGCDRKFKSTSNRSCDVASDFTNSQYIRHAAFAGRASHCPLHTCSGGGIIWPCGRSWVV